MTEAALSEWLNFLLAIAAVPVGVAVVALIIALAVWVVLPLFILWARVPDAEGDEK